MNEKTDEELVLAYRNGDQSAGDTLIDKYTLFIRLKAKQNAERYANSFNVPIAVLREEAYSAAWLGFLQALPHWEPEKGTLKMISASYIRYSVLEAFNQLRPIRLSRKDLALLKNIRAAEVKLQEIGLAATDTAIAMILGVDKKTIQDTLFHAMITNPASLNQTLGDEGDEEENFSWMDILRDDRLEEETKDRELHSVLAQLPADERMIAWAYEAGYSDKEIIKMLGDDKKRFETGKRELARTLGVYSRADR